MYESLHSSPINSSINSLHAMSSSKLWQLMRFTSTACSFNHSQDKTGTRDIHKCTIRS